MLSRSPSSSLPAIVATMIQLAADELPELATVREALASVRDQRMAQEQAPSLVAELLGQAIVKLDALLAGTEDTLDPSEILAAATSLVCLATSTDAAPAHVPSRAPARNPRSEMPAFESMLPPATSIVPRQGSVHVTHAPGGSLLPARVSARVFRRVTLMPTDQDQELLGEFFAEANEHIAAAEAALLTLEAQPDDQSAVNTVFRAFHTVKGVAAMLGMTAVAQLAHHAESLLSRIRDGEIRCTGGYANLCLRGVDMLKETLASATLLSRGQPAELPTGYFELVDALIHSDTIAAQPPPAANEPAQGLAIAEAPAPTVLAVSPSATAAGATSAPTWVTQGPSATARVANGDAPTQDSVRVRTDRLDRLVDMVGELVIAHSMVSQDEQATAEISVDLAKKVGHVGKIVRDLQDLSMSLRMVPLKPTFQKLARIARDVANKSNKSLQFLSEGEETEIDRNMVDALAEPLVHMVRNAADHGIETAAQREKAGKPAQGTIRLHAYHMGGQVVIDLSDDGGGLDRERIVKKALTKQLISSEKNLSDSDVFQLIFEPGFSTNEAVTDVSGRGVGMDVVRKNIDRLKGRIEISSERGQGTLFSIRLPLTLAITDGMLVRVGAERYIIPTRDISVNFRPEPEQLSSVIGRGEMVMLRGSALPLFRLHELFGVEGAVHDPCRALVVVLHDGPSSCGLLVDELLGQHQVVAKSLGPAIGQIPAVSGGAILGDGRVGLILDPSSLISLARQRRTLEVGVTKNAAPTPRMVS
jgi:two-component system chemotaxis sensor kinase CheA